MDSNKIIASFDSLAAGYNHSALRFFPFSADRLVGLLKPRPGQKVLDVATGTGVVAMSCAQAVGPQGRVMGIDLSEGMMAKAEQSFKKMGLENIDLFTMDASRLDFKNNYFDAVTCSFGLFFLPDMLSAVREWRRVLKPEGTVIFSSFGENAFHPLVKQLADDLADAGADLTSLTMASQRLNQSEQCLSLLEQAGFNDCRIDPIQVGYHLRDGQEWWDVVWNSGIRNLVMQLPESEHEAFRQQHTSKINEFATDKGVWLDVPVMLCQGRK